MLIRIRDLVNIADEKVYEVNIPMIVIDNNQYLRRLEDNKGYFRFYYDFEDRLCIKYELKGKMVCPDSISLEDIYMPYEISDEEAVAFKESEEGFYLLNEIEIDKLVYNVALPEAPIIVENSNKKGYYSGDGWSIMSEEEYGNRRKNMLDPRLEVLKDYKEEK